MKIPSFFKVYLPISLITIIFLLFQNNSLNEKVKHTDVKNTIVKESETNTKILQSISLPLKYISEDLISWGSVNTDRDTKDKSTWKSAAVDMGSRDTPTTNITLSKDDYSNAHEDLPAIKSIEEITSETNGRITSESLIYQETLAKYGDFGIRFFPTYYPFIKNFDVDADGKDEKVVYLCGIGGNHCPHKIVIVKDDKIIFSVSAGMTDLGLSPSETNNGFYVEWVPTDNGWVYGLCCPPGFVKTRFVYTNNEFIPIYEQTHMYVEVVNTE